MTKIEALLADLKTLIPGTRISPLNQDPVILRHKSPLGIRQHFLVEQLKCHFQKQDAYSEGMLFHLHNFTSGKFRLHASFAGRWGLCLLDGERSLKLSDATTIKTGVWKEFATQEMILTLQGLSGASWLCVVYSSNTNAQIDCDCLQE